MRQEFDRKTKIAAWNRCGGFCECGAHEKPMKIFRAEYHHVLPCALGGTNDLSNCMVMDARCHRIQTSTKDVPKIAKAKRIEEKRAGLRKSRRPMAKRVDPWNRGRDT